MNGESDDQKPQHTLENPPPDFMKEFEKTIQSYADAVNADKPEEAQQAAMSMLMMAAQEAMEHPTPELILAGEADDSLRAGDWAKAEDAYRKLLAIQEQTGNFGLIAKPRMNLSELFFLLGRLDEAWEFACAATASARRMDVYPLTVMALENETACALARGDNNRALAAASEAVQVIEPGKLGDSMRARALALRARCLLAAGEVEAAERDLRSSWDILSASKSFCFGTGPVVLLARWWEVQAGVHVNKGALADAAAALQQAMEYRREAFNRSCGGPSPHGLAALARDFEKLAEIRKQSGDARAAQEALTEAQALWQSIHLPR